MSSPALQPIPPATPVTPVKTTTTYAPFWRDVYSDHGEPSSSRVLTSVLSLVVSAILLGTFWHLWNLKDAPMLGLWLAALPGIIFALIAVAISPYGVNQLSGMPNDIFSGVTGFFKKGPQQ